MNGLRSICGLVVRSLAMLLVAAAAGARAGLTDPAADFAHAKEAYDAGRFEESGRLYGALLAAGIETPEVAFNLGNAWFRQGDAGRAVLAWRCAWRLAPRDPDIARNLEMARQTTGAPPVSPPWYARPLERLSRREWALALGAAYWLTAVLVAVRLLLRRRSELLRRATAAGLIAVAVCAAGWWHWRTYDLQPELVVTGSGQNALFAPLDSATVHFALPPGSVVRELAREGAWIKVGLGNRAGWMHASAAVVADMASLRAPAVTPPPAPR